MYYYEWHQQHNKKVLIIKKKLEKLNYSKEEIIDYFNYDNMIIKEPEFCLLYKDKKKCHEIKKLNCYLCACPHFLYSDEVPIKDNIYSICKINSKFKKNFEFDSKIHCDCSNCYYPHKKNIVFKYYDTLKELKDYPNNETLLEKIRNFQLIKILGKFKLF